MTFARTWLWGYRSPSRFIAGLAKAPAPGWGLLAVLLRGLMLSLLFYVPLHFLGRQPPTPSYLTFVSTERYYLALAGFVPFFLLAQWLLLSATLHLILRLLGYPGGIDQILNLMGLVALVVGTFLVCWDWLWLLVGWGNQVILGLSHLFLDGWQRTSARPC